MPGKSKYDGQGQRKFIRNMAAGAALGATAGNAGAVVATRGKAKFRPVKSAAIGGAAGGTAGTAAVVHHRRKKVRKSMSEDGLSAFGVVHEMRS